ISPVSKHGRKIVLEPIRSISRCTTENICNLEKKRRRFDPVARCNAAQLRTLSYVSHGKCQSNSDYSGFRVCSSVCSWDNLTEVCVILLSTSQALRKPRQGSRRHGAPPPIDLRERVSLQCSSGSRDRRR